MDDKREREEDSSSLLLLKEIASVWFSLCLQTNRSEPAVIRQETIKTNSDTNWTERGEIRNGDENQASVQSWQNIITCPSFNSPEVPDVVLKSLQSFWVFFWNSSFSRLLVGASKNALKMNHSSNKISRKHFGNIFKKTVFISLLEEKIKTKQDRLLSSSPSCPSCSLLTSCFKHLQTRAGRCGPKKIPR